MAEEIVEQVGLDQIVELGALADPHRHREAPVRQVIVEHRVGDEAGHADDAPAGQRLEPRIDRVEVGNAVADAQRLEALAGIPAQAMLLGQAPSGARPAAPHRLVFVRVEVEVLRHGPIGRHAGVVAAQAGKGDKSFHGVNITPRAVSESRRSCPSDRPDLDDILYRKGQFVENKTMIELDDIDKKHRDGPAGRRPAADRRPRRPRRPVGRRPASGA